MTDHAETVRKFFTDYDASAGANRSVFLDLCADNVEFGSLGGETPGAEFLSTSRSKAEVAAYLDDLFAQWDMSHYKVHDIVAQGDRVVVMANILFTNKATGKVLDSRKADFIRFEGGKIVEFFEYFDTAAFRAAM